MIKFFKPKANTSMNFFDKKQKLQNVGFSEQFIIEAVEGIDKKEIFDYIVSRVESTFQTNKFYYAYTYKDDILTFIAFVSNKHLKNKVPYFYHVLLEEGKFAYKWEDTYYLIERKGSDINVRISSELEEGYVLKDIDPKAKIKLKYSLDKKELPILYFSMLIFGLSVLNFLYTTSVNLPTLPPPEVRVNIIEPPQLQLNLDQIVRFLDKDSYIKKLELKNNMFEYTIHFDSQEKMKGFIQAKGGKINGENEVIFTLPAYSN
ncbi:MAG: hypothetical protein NC925_05255 [Candidatus Omnitrophica bacterium]|nr:hypothetical protein [Candidatus Omnitrophota bacterium]